MRWVGGILPWRGGRGVLLQHEVLFSIAKMPILWPESGRYRRPEEGAMTHNVP